MSKLNELRCTSCNKVLAFARGLAYNTSHQYAQNEPSVAHLVLDFKGRAKVISQDIEANTTGDRIELFAQVNICCRECGRTSVGTISLNEWHQDKYKTHY